MNWGSLVFGCFEQESENSSLVLKINKTIEISARAGDFSVLITPDFSLIGAGLLFCNRGLLVHNICNRGLLIHNIFNFLLFRCWIILHVDLAVVLLFSRGVRI